MKPNFFPDRLSHACASASVSAQSLPRIVPIHQAPQTRLALSITSALLFAIAGAPNNLQAAAVGLSQGKLSADPSGGASYDMPIVVSPGTAGMQPKLAFHYSSRGRNGALGVGWSIS